MVERVSLIGVFRGWSTNVGLCGTASREGRQADYVWCCGLVSTDARLIHCRHRGYPMRYSTPEGIEAWWSGTLVCKDQRDPKIVPFFNEIVLQSDPVGATWGTGVWRAPNVRNWGWTAERVGMVEAPTMFYRR